MAVREPFIYIEISESLLVEQIHFIQTRQPQLF